MVKVELGRQLMIMVDNKVGSLAEVMDFISSSGINQIAVCAYEIGNKVATMFITEDNNAAKHLLEDHGLHVEEEEVVLLTVDNRPGALQRVMSKIADAGINLKLIYGSVPDKSVLSRIVMIAENNLDVMMLVKTELERSE